MVYYYASPKGEVWMLTLYAKNVRESIPAHVLREIMKEIGNA
ncbi:MAG: hypothetical protein AAF993_19870 [Pseudomonadota bacterium]